MGLALERIRVLLADDHKTILDTVTRILAREFDVVGAVSDGRTALEETERLQPDVLITDISMPGMSGMEAVRQLTAANSDVRVVFLTVHENAEYVRESIAIGALGYVVKSRMVSDLADAIKAAHGGHHFVSPFTPL
jgi:DNA-binding NarL/FixJ family response regulator